MLFSEAPSIHLDDRPMAMSDWEKAEKACDFSCVYERKASKAHYETTLEKDSPKSQDIAECRCLRQDSPSSLRCSMHKEFFPSLEAINEEEADERKAVNELDMKYDLSLSDRHYAKAQNMGYLRHRKGRHYRRKAFEKGNDMPRRERSVTF